MSWSSTSISRIQNKVKIFAVTQRDQQHDMCSVPHQLETKNDMDMIKTFFNKAGKISTYLVQKWLIGRRTAANEKLSTVQSFSLIKKTTKSTSGFLNNRLQVVACNKYNKHKFW